MLWKQRLGKEGEKGADEPGGFNLAMWNGGERGLPKGQ